MDRPGLVYVSGFSISAVNWTCLASSVAMRASSVATCFFWKPIALRASAACCRRSLEEVVITGFEDAAGPVVAGRALVKPLPAEAAVNATRAEEALVFSR